MPDDTLPGNFINPDYATPEQLAQLRAYSNYLLQGKGQQEVHRPLQGVSNIVSALVGGYQARQADQMQSAAASRQNAIWQQALIKQLQNAQSGQLGGGLPAPPQVPMSSTGDNITPPPRAPVPSSPTVMGDAEGIAKGIYPSGGSASPPAQPPAGGALPQPGAAPMSFAPPPGTPNTFAQRFQPAGTPPGMDPRLIGALMADPLASQEQKAQMFGLVAPQNVQDVYGRPGQLTPLTGNIRSVQTPPGYQPGVRVPVATTGEGGASATQIITPNGATIPGLGGGGGNGLAGLAEFGRQQGAESRRTSGGANAEADVIKQDVSAAAAAPDTLKSLGLIEDNIRQLGPNLTFGPTAQLSNEFRRVIANYAPSLANEKALAGADMIEKLNLGLAGNLSKQLGINPSDIRLSVGSVPGNEKSARGTLALLDMMKQSQQKAMEVGTLYQQYRNAGRLKDWGEARSQFYRDHPVINPVTNNPIQIDAQRAQQQQRPKTVIQNGHTYTLGADGNYH